MALPAVQFPPEWRAAPVDTTPVAAGLARHARRHGVARSRGGGAGAECRPAGGGGAGRGGGGAPASWRAPGSIPRSTSSGTAASGSGATPPVSTRSWSGRNGRRTCGVASATAGPAARAGQDAASADLVYARQSLAGMVAKSWYLAAELRMQARLTAAMAGRQRRAPRAGRRGAERRHRQRRGRGARQWGRGNLPRPGIAAHPEPGRGGAGTRGPPGTVSRRYAGGSGEPAPGDTRRSRGTSGKPDRAAAGPGRREPAGEQLVLRHAAGGRRQAAGDQAHRLLRGDQQRGARAAVGFRQPGDLARRVTFGADLPRRGAAGAGGHPHRRAAAGGGDVRGGGAGGVPRRRGRAGRRAGAPRAPVNPERGRRSTSRARWP